MITNLLLGLFSGIAFGFVIQRIGATDPNRMTRAHLMLDADIPRFMLATVALSAAGRHRKTAIAWCRCSSTTHRPHG